MYSTVTDVRNALNPGGAGRGANDGTALNTPGGGGTAAALDDAAITDAIREADGTIQTYLRVGTVYAVPTEQVVQNGTAYEVALAPVRYWSRNIGAYLATLTWRRGKDLSSDDPVRLRYTDTMTILTAIRDGKGQAPLPPPTPPNATSGGFTQNPYEGSLFTSEDFGLHAEPFPVRRH